MFYRIFDILIKRFEKKYRKTETVSEENSFILPYKNAHLWHEGLGYEIELKVPARATHREAVRKNLAGKYYEPISHLNFKKILDYKGNQSVIHAGTFFGDMLHTYSVNARKVYAFEPVLENYFFAKKNAEELGLENVILFNAALSNDNGINLISTHNKQGLFRGGASTIRPDFIGTNERIATFRIDDLPIEELCLIQLDVEGYEKQALLGAVNTVEWFSPIILLEDKKKNCATLLERMGYSFSFAADGLSYWATASDLDFVDGLKG